MSVVVCTRLKVIRSSEQSGWFYLTNTTFTQVYCTGNALNLSALINSSHLTSVLSPDWLLRPGSPLPDELQEAATGEALPAVAEEPGGPAGAEPGSDWRILHPPTSSRLLGDAHEGEER